MKDLTKECKISIIEGPNVPKSLQETDPQKSAVETKVDKDAVANPIISTPQSTKKQHHSADGKKITNAEKLELTEKRREKVKDYTDNYGFFNIPNYIKDELSVQFKVSRKTIEDDIELLLKEFDDPSIPKLARKMLSGFNKTMREAQRLMTNEDSNLRAKGVDSYTKAIEAFTKFLENYGYKERVAERIAIEQGNMLKKDNPEIQKLLETLNPEQAKSMRNIFFGVKNG